VDELSRSISDDSAEQFIPQAGSVAEIFRCDRSELVEQISYSYVACAVGLGTGTSYRAKAKRFCVSMTRKIAFA
jgi:hypothetical protein